MAGFRLRKHLFLLVGVAGLIVLTLVGSVSYWYVLRVRPIGLLYTQAQEQLREEDWGGAIRSLQRLLQLNPRHVEANLLAGDILFQFQHPSTLHYYTIAQQEAPQRWDIWKRVVDYHILVSDRYQALKWIEDTPGEPENEERWWDAYFHFSLKSGDIPEARRAAEQLISMDGAKRLSWEFLLAQLNAQEPGNESLRQAGRQRLLELYESSEVWKHDAARVYVESLLTFGKRKEAVHFAIAWMSGEGVRFEDAIYALESAITGEMAWVNAALPVARASADVPERVARLMQWYLSREREAEMRLWLDEVPQAVLDSPEVISIFTVHHARRNEWDHIRENYLADEAIWFGNRSLYFLYSAYLDFATTGQVNKQKLQQSSLEAAREAGGYYKVRLGCQRLDWVEGWRDLLPLFLYEKTTGFQAAQELYRQAIEKKRYDDLLLIASRAYASKPDDYSASNNYAYLSLVNGRVTGEVLAIAKKNFSEQPERPHSRVTWALALWRQGDDEQAWNVIGETPNALRQHPSIAYVRALVAASVLPAEAASFRDKLKQENYSPAEWDLVLADPSLRRLPDETPVASSEMETLRHLVRETQFAQGWATRSFIRLLLNEGMSEEARNVVREWMRSGHFSFEDAYFCLTAWEDQAQEETVQELLEACQSTVATAADAARVKRWMLNRLGEEPALRWVAKLPPVLSDSLEVRRTYGLWLARNKRWQDLKDKVVAQATESDRQTLEFLILEAVCVDKIGSLNEQLRKDQEVRLRKAALLAGNDPVKLRKMEERFKAWDWAAGWETFYRLHAEIHRAEVKRLDARTSSREKPKAQSEMERLIPLLVDQPDNTEYQAEQLYWRLVQGETPASLRPDVTRLITSGNSGPWMSAVQALAMILDGKSIPAREHLEEIPTRWKYHPRILWVRALAARAAAPDEFPSLIRALNEQKYTEEEWRLLNPQP
ncbi:MAG: hypothetical protein ACFCUX_07775 [Candidatus Methylacidiphilales bacterium]